MLLTVLLRLNNACEEQDFHLLYQVFHPWLRLVLVPETPCNSISSVSHTVSPLKHKYGMHIASGTNQFRELPHTTITHFVEHSTRLYDCKSYIIFWIAFTNWWPKMIFFLFISHIYELSFVFLQAVEQQRAQDASVRNIFKSPFELFVSKQSISSVINPYESPHRI